MQKYEEPEMKVVRMIEDVIATSDGSDIIDKGDEGYEWIGP